MIKRGKVSIQYVLEIETRNICPMGAGKWKIAVQTRQCLFKVRVLGPGEIFGHDELLAHFDKITELVRQGKGAANVRIPKRYYRVVAET